MNGWGKCYVETEDWDYCERMEYRHCLWRGSVCPLRRSILSEKNLRGQWLLKRMVSSEDRKSKVCPTYQSKDEADGNRYKLKF